MPGQVLFKEIRSRVALSQDEFEAVAAYFTYSTINKKHKLVSEGRPNDKAFFIQKGLLFSYRTMESGDTQVVQFGKEIIGFPICTVFCPARRRCFPLKPSSRVSCGRSPGRTWIAPSRRATRLKPIGGCCFKPPTPIRWFDSLRSTRRMLKPSTIA